MTLSPTEQELQHGLGNGRLKPYVQPKLELGSTALMQHSVLGVLPLSHFLSRLTAYGILDDPLFQLLHESAILLRLLQD
ncbi:hypothetical protein OOJ96_02730 [Pseudomonas sp. 15FMM2]|uniref:Uncharacterized protein n=1 Tax=Pseudomonas imrae TaxID=2992837 RepID=A0ACC7P8L4_9PSED